MSVQNDPRFLSPMGSRLARIGLEPKDAALGRYIEIDLRTPRPEPEEFAEYGEFDTFTVLNSNEIPRGAKVWLYFNLKSPEYRLPLQDVRIIDTIADRFYLQHDEPIDVTLRIIIGGDLRAMNVVPKEQGSSDITGTVDITDRETRKLGEVSVPGVASDSTLNQVIAALGPLATENTLAQVLSALEPLATENTLEQVLSALEPLATENTLAQVLAILGTIATEATLGQVLAALGTVATETTLGQVLSALGTIATESTLAQVLSVLQGIQSELETQTQLLEAIKTNTTPGP